MWKTTVKKKVKIGDTNIQVIGQINLNWEDRDSLSINSRGLAKLGVGWPKDQEIKELQVLGRKNARERVGQDASKERPWKVKLAYLLTKNASTGYISNGGKLRHLDTVVRF